MTVVPTCPVCGAVVSTYGLHREHFPIDDFRLFVTGEHIGLVPCGCRLRNDETFRATYSDPELTELIRIEGVGTDS